MNEIAIREYLSVGYNNHFTEYHPKASNLEVEYFDILRKDGTFLNDLYHDNLTNGLIILMTI